MTVLNEHIDKLINPWTMVLTAKEAGSHRPQDFPPMMDMLRTLVRPNMERTGGGSSPATRNLVDTTALTLLMHIEDVTRAWLVQWGVKVSGEIKLDLRGYNDRLDALWRTDAITQTEYTRLLSYPETWAGKIWDILEPPLQVTLKEAECPNCGRAKWINENDDHVDNLIVSYRDGGEVQAECRWNDCNGFWAGTRALRELGFHVGATVDDDALRAMGVDV